MKKIIKHTMGIIMAVSMLSTVNINTFAEIKEYYQGTYDDSLYRMGGYDAGYDPNYDCNAYDTQETKYLLKENFIYANNGGGQSGWDLRTIGGSIKAPYYHGNHQLIDTSEYYPVEISRNFEHATHGEVTFETQVKFDDGMNGASLTIYGENKAAVKLETNDNKIYLKNNDGDIYLYDYKPNSFFGIKVIMDVDRNIVKAVYMSGIKRGENLPFTNKVNYINWFSANTGDEAIGTLAFNLVYIYRGYYMNELFTAAMYDVPQDFEHSDNVKMVNWESSMKSDVYSMQLDGSNGRAYVKKRFDNASGKLKFTISLYSDTANNIKLSLLNNDEKKVSIDINNGTMSCGGVSEDFKTGIWNNIRMELDPNSETAKLFVNYRQRGEDIAYSAKNINGIQVETDGDVLTTDDYRLETIYPEPEDYVPEPQPAQSEGYNIGMQLCPMWDEGGHNGWDTENAYREKLPYLGFYDCSSPEANDWIIKQLVEHGVDFMKITWCGEPTSAPVKSGFIGWQQIDGYMQSKYASYLPFMIMWENVAMDGDAWRLVNNLAPYWIEYYFKNDNYYKINGRPVFGIYSIDTFVKKTEKSGGKAQDCIDALKRFREMCVEAGVGEPIIIGGGTTINGEVVAEGSQPYWLGGSTAFVESAYAGSKTTKAENNGTMYVPVMGPGIVDDEKSAFISPSEFKEQLIEYRDGFFKTNNSGSPLDNMLMLETYDEYSEGHWLAPSTLHGFGYLDAARDVFTKGGEHIDAVPNMKQKDRFNNLYYSGRQVKRLDPNIKGDGSKDHLDVKYGWYFDKSGDTEGWSSANVSNLKVEDGVLKGKALTNDPQVCLYNAGLDISDVTYLRIRYRHDKQESMQMFFDTSDSPGLNEWKSLVCAVPDDKMHEVDIFMGAFKSFDGELKTLRIDPGQSQNSLFEIDSIELLYDTEYSKKLAEKPVTGFDTEIDSVMKHCNTDYVEVGEEKYFPLREIAEMMNAKVDYDGHNNTVNVLYNDMRFRINLNTGDAVLNDRALNAENPMYFENGITYVTQRTLSLVFGVDAKWQSNEKKLEILSEAGAEMKYNLLRKETPRKSLRKWDFDEENNAEGWTYDGNNVTSLSSSAGSLNAEIKKELIIYTPDNLAVSTKALQKLSFKLKNPTKASSVSIYYILDGDTAWNEAKKLTVKVDKQSNEFKEYTADITALKAVDDNIKRIRLSLNGVLPGDKVSFDYLYLEGEEIKAASGNSFEWYEQGDHITKTDNMLSWEFYTNGPDNGWFMSRSFSNISMHNGILNAEITGSTPAMQTQNLKLDADKVKSIKIKLKNNTPSTAAKLYFMNKGDSSYSDDKSFQFKTYSYDTVGSEYEIIPAENDKWLGEVVALRLEPAYDKGSIGVDYIRIEMK